MRLRQVALVARDLDGVTDRLGRLLGIDYGYHDPGIIKFGLDNWVAAIGDTYLEVVSPVQDNTTAGRYLDRRGGDGGYMVILQVPDLDEAKARIENAGARIVWNAEGKENGEVTRGLHVHPRDCGGAILSIDHSSPTEAWVWAGPERLDHDSSYLSQICGVEMQSSDPEGMASRWCELLGTTASEGDGPDGRAAFSIDLDSSDPMAEGSSEPTAEGSSEPRAAGRKNGALRFVKDDDGRGDGVTAFDVRVKDRGALERLGDKLERNADAAWADVAGVRVFFVD